MRVALDTNPLYTTRAGVARYVRGLKQGLSELDRIDLEIAEIAWEVENLDYRQPTRALKTFYRELIWAPFIAPSKLKRAKIDILHSTAGPFINASTEIRSVVTLHDLAVLRHPNRFRRWHRMSAQTRLKKLGRADRIICVSKFTADEAMKLLGVANEKLEVIYNGVEILSAGDLASPNNSPDLPPEFLLFVGSLEPGKNLSLLKEMYFLAEDSGKYLPSLVIIGARWPGVDSEGAIPKNWVYLGNQPDAVLASAYRRAIALLFPSIYEGFGIPIVEAQAANCPVICSPVASLPEVAGNAAIFAGLTASEYLHAFSRLEHESGLRDNLIREGQTNASRFCWRRCAEQVTEVYRQVHGQ